MSTAIRGKPRPSIQETALIAKKQKVKPSCLAEIFKIKDVSKIILSFLEHPFKGSGAGHFFTICPLNMTSWWLTNNDPPFPSITVSPETINRVGKCVRIISHKVTTKKNVYKQLSEIHFICSTPGNKFYFKGLWILSRMQKCMETPNLTHVSLIFPNDPKPFLEKLSSFSIRKLKLYLEDPYACPLGLRDFKELQSLNITLSHEHGPLDLNPLCECMKLTSLTVEDDLQGRFGTSPRVDFSFLEKHAALSHLSLKLNFSEENRQIIPKGCPSLEELDFSLGRIDREFVFFSDEQVAALSLPNLTRLNLALCRTLTDAAFQNIEKQFPKLKWINLSSTNISDSAVPYLKKLSQIEEIILRDCPGLSRPKMKELMESEKPKFEFSGKDIVKILLYEKNQART